MSAFRAHTSLLDHPKFQGLGPNAGVLWAGAGSAVAGTSGVVAGRVLAELGEVWPDLDVVAGAAVLVDRGLWHDAATVSMCDRCSSAVDLPAGAFYFHDWNDHQAAPER